MPSSPAKPPFTGTTIVEVFQAKFLGAFPPARHANPDVPEKLDLIILKMAAKDVGSRYKSCEEVINDLESLGIASETLSFLGDKPTFAKDITASDDDLAKTTVIEAAVKTSAEHAYADVAAPAIADPNTWYVQMKQPDGASITRRYTTAQLVKMLDDGTIYASAKASHGATDGFRGLGTYREFQGAALSTVTKKAADKKTTRTRGEARRLDFVDRDRVEQEERDNEPETALQANLRYWLGLAVSDLTGGAALSDVRRRAVCLRRRDGLERQLVGAGGSVRVRGDLLRSAAFLQRAVMRVVAHRL